MQTKIRYQRKQRSMRPLFRRALYVYQQFSEDIDQLPTIDKMCHQGELCASSTDTDQKSDTPSTFSKVAKSSPQHPGATCCVANASTDGVLKQFGKANTIHWMVPPGRHRYESEVTEQFGLPFDTTAHYVTGHLHPFALSLSLIDAKTGKTVFHIRSRDYEDRRGVAFMSEIVSSKGMPLAKGQRFILRAEYNNTSEKPIDAMAILYVYLLDQGARERQVATRPVTPSS